MLFHPEDTSRDKYTVKEVIINLKHSWFQHDTIDFPSNPAERLFTGLLDLWLTVLCVMCNMLMVQQAASYILDCCFHDHNADMNTSFLLYLIYPEDSQSLPVTLVGLGSCG